MKTCVALAMAVVLAVGARINVHALDGQFAVVSITSLSGDDGHAFVYAQVTDSSGNYPAPLGTSFRSPYYSQWRAFPTLSSACPWIWAVYTYDRATNRLLNGLPPGSPGPNLGTTTFFCPTPTVTPVGVPPMATARARLDLDLLVALVPPMPTAGTPATLSALLTGSLTNDLNLYLSMSIQDWSVNRWFADFGDGSQQTLRNGGTSLTVSHVFASPGRYFPRVVAYITGHAQAAAYDRFGNPYLLQRTFSVEIGSSTSGRVMPGPLRSYFPPRVRAGVSPTIEGSGVPPGIATFAHVEVLRGVMTDFSVRLIVDKDGYFTSNGVPVGSARSVITGWRYLGPPTDGPRGLGTRPKSFHGPGELLRLQWDTPDHVTRAGARDYTISLVLYFRTVYSDGHAQFGLVTSGVAVTVDFTAQAA